MIRDYKSFLEGYLDQYYFEIDNDEHHQMWGQSGVRMGANQTKMTDREKELVSNTLGKRVKWEFNSRTMAGNHSIKIFGKDFDWVINKVLDDWYIVSKLIMRPSFRVRNWKCDNTDGLVRFLKAEVLKSDDQPELGF